MADPIAQPPGPRAVATGDPRASGDAQLLIEVERLFALYGDRLTRHVYHYVQSWETAEDLVQDLFLTLWDRRAELENVGDAQAYLYMAARNRALAHLRRANVREDWSAERSDRALAGLEARPGDDPERAVHAGEIAAAVQRAVDDLPLRQREALLLQWKGQSYAQIAAALDISPKTVAIHLTRAIERLRQALHLFRG